MNTGIYWISDYWEPNTSLFNGSLLSLLTSQWFHLPPPPYSRGDIQQSSIRVGFAPVSNLSSFYIPISKKKVLYASLELCIPFNYSKCTDFRIWINYKTTAFSRFCFHSHMISFVGPFGPFYRPKWQISLPSHILPPVKFLPFHSKAWKRYPFRAERPWPCIEAAPSGTFPHLTIIN